MATHTLTGTHGRPDEDHYRRRGFTAAPLVVQWMATLRCPLRCPHCLAADGAGQADMPLGPALDLIDQAAEMGVAELLVTGGEPLVREDLDEVIDHLRRRGQPWSLNTAIAPPVRLRRAIERHPPRFAAVSLDGPAGVHDTFRGRAGAFDDAQEAIDYFAALDGTIVAAGTTVTRRNFDALKLTRTIVRASAADEWGIHLLVPEGRAAARNDLELSRRQMRTLLSAVIRWRRTMRVNLADEIGYCGRVEPLLRDEPFACGAGRTQCVVLPDGNVVPCTTLDVSTAAGSLHERTLAEIWRDGFAELRAYAPRGKCRSCEHAAACGGGCWLHRRAGTQCHKDVWSWGPLVRTAAGVVLCLAAGTGAADPPSPRPPARERVRPASRTADQGGNLAAAEAHIVRLYTHRFTMPMRTDRRSRGSRRAPVAPAVPERKLKEPVWKLIDLWQRDQLPQDFDKRCELAEAVLRSDCENLAVIGLTLRTLADPIVGGIRPIERRTTEQHRRLVRLLAAMQDKAFSAHRAYLEGIVRRYAAGRNPPMRPMSKAGPRPHERLAHDNLTKRLGFHYGTRPDDLEQRLARGKDAPHWRQRMLVSVELTGEGSLTLHSGAALPRTAAKLSVGAFEALETPEADAPVEVRMSWPQQPQQRWTLPLPAGTKLTWPDLLHAFGRAHGAEVYRDLADRLRSGKAMSDNPLYLPAVRELPAGLASPPGAIGHISGVGGALRASVHYWLADFWML